MTVSAPQHKSTLETRWFFREPPFPTASLFSTDSPPHVRTDWYAFPCDPRCGVKIREGRLETKLQTHAYGTFDLDAQGIQGELESWTKWSVEYDVEPPSERLLADTGWVAVHKQRFLRSFNVVDDGLQETELRPTNGCDVELTILEMADQQWWTVGLEAIGPPDELRHNLGMVALATLGTLQLASHFRRDNSFSYPVWLAHVGETR